MIGDAEREGCIGSATRVFESADLALHPISATRPRRDGALSVQSSRPDTVSSPQASQPRAGSGSRRLAKVTGQRIALHASTWSLHAELHDFVDAPTRKNLASPQLDFNDRRQFLVFGLYIKNCGVRTLV